MFGQAWANPTQIGSQCLFCVSIMCPTISLINTENSTLGGRCDGCTSVTCLTISLKNRESPTMGGRCGGCMRVVSKILRYQHEIVTACHAKYIWAADACSINMARNEVALVEYSLRRRERDGLKREKQTPEERYPRSLNWAFANMRFCYIDWPGLENMTDVGMLLWSQSNTSSNGKDVGMLRWCQANTSSRGKHVNDLSYWWILNAILGFHYSFYRVDLSPKPLQQKDQGGFCHTMSFK